MQLGVKIPNVFSRPLFLFIVMGVKTGIFNNICKGIFSTPLYLPGLPVLYLASALGKP